MGRVGRRLTDAIKAATGERIVAFGRAGKPPENPFLRPHFSARFLVPARLLKTSGYSATAF
jgi:hypothetical protein